MKKMQLLLIVVVLTLAGCAGDEASEGAQSGPTAAPAQQGATPTRQVIFTAATPTGQGSAQTTPSDPPTQPPPTEQATQPTPQQGRPTEVVPPQYPVALPEGFGISVYAERLNDPRMMALGPDGMLYVAERAANRIIRLPDRNSDGLADGVEVVADEINAPSSIAFYQDGSLYVGQTRRIIRLSGPDADGRFTEREVIVDGLPGGGHNTRTVLFSPDWRWMYVSVGSSCNVCIEDDPRRATIVRYTPEGEDEQIFTKGLRNAVGITFRPGTEELWATNNGRDTMGDDLPPETVNMATEGADFGWPRCHAGDIIDPEFGDQGGCEGVATPAVKMQAHSAPLGLAFYTGTQFPEEYHGDLFVAFHGSWNRSVPTGYKVVRIPIENGQAGEPEDFASGWLREDGEVWGRPVDVLVAPDGSLWVSDDGAGRIYRIFYAPAAR